MATIGNNDSQELDSYARKINSPFYRFFDGVFFLVKLNIAILLGSVLGLVIFGLIPSILAASKLSDEFLNREDGYVFRRFFDYWKEYFWEGVRFTIVVLAGISIGFAAWFFLWYVTHPIWATVAYIVFFILGISYIFMVINYPVLRLYYSQLRETRLLSVSIVYGWVHFLTSLLVIVAYALTILFFLTIPQFGVFVVLALPVFAQVAIIRRAFVKKEEEEEFIDQE